MGGLSGPNWTMSSDLQTVSSGLNSVPGTKQAQVEPQNMEKLWNISCNLEIQENFKMKEENAISDL